MKHRMILFMAAAGFSALSSRAAEPELIYVQPVKTNLKGEASLGSANIVELKRGDKLTVLKKEGIWFQASVGGKTGWVSKLFVANHPPVGESELSNSLKDDADLGRAAHKRAGSVAVSASTRGLVAGNRSRDNREKYDSDFDAIQKMESLKLSETELQTFRNTGGLAP